MDVVVDRGQLLWTLLLLSWSIDIGLDLLLLPLPCALPGPFRSLAAGCRGRRLRLLLRGCFVLGRGDLRGERGCGLVGGLLPEDGSDCAGCLVFVINYAYAKKNRSIFLKNC